jgi:FKBP-type peptidyl-prolyl cis-trans isomerase 2
VARRAAALVLSALALLPAACSRGGARPGDRLRLHYRVFADGRVYDTTEGSAPVELVLGRGALPAAVEAQLLGMRPGEERTLTVPDAYGKAGAGELQKVPAGAFARLGERPRRGMKVLGVKDGAAAEALVVDADSATVTLSFAHPLAGKTVSFTLRLVSIER